MSIRAKQTCGNSEISQAPPTQIGNGDLFFAKPSQRGTSPSKARTLSGQQEAELQALVFGLRSLDCEVLVLSMLGSGAEFPSLVALLRWAGAQGSSQVVRRPGGQAALRRAGFARRHGEAAGRRRSKGPPGSRPPGSQPEVARTPLAALLPQIRLSICKGHRLPFDDRPVLVGASA